MQLKSENPSVEWSKITGDQCLRFEFGEQLTELDAVNAITEWKEAFQSKEGKKICLIWDCRKMKGYETGARTHWTAALKEMKPQIGKIWLISESTFIRMGGAVMAMFTSLEIKPVSSESEILS
jgi:hypothetical protein